MAVLRCKVVCSKELAWEQTVWFGAAVEDKGVSTPVKNPEEPVFQIEDGKKEDLRKHPPYLVILPCPYCGAMSEGRAGGTTEDRGHKIEAHIDHRLGVPIHETSFHVAAGIKTG